jgi:hypothetical protein
LKAGVARTPAAQTDWSQMATKRETLRKQLFPADKDLWTGEEVGWFKLPRTFPLLTALLKKDVRGKEDPTSTYLELLSHHYGGGFIILNQESEHAFASGYAPSRLRSWRERMAKLEELGFIKTKGVGGQTYKYVLLIHPTSVVEQLRLAGKVSEEWLNTYEVRKTATKELTFAQRAADQKRAAKAAKARRSP